MRQFNVSLIVAAIRLRREGLTYREINEELGIPDGRTCRVLNSKLGRFLAAIIK